MIFLKKRAVTVILMFLLVFSVVGVRTAKIASGSVQAAAHSSAKSIDIATLRGTVYDCRMKPLTNGETELYAAAKPTNSAIYSLKGRLSPQVFDSVMQRMSKGSPVAVKVDYPDENCPDILEFEVPSRYSSDSLACHLIGYLGSDGRGVSGIEKAFDSVLSENNSTVRVRFSANARGKIMLGEKTEISGNSAPKNGVKLTVDSDIQRIAENALDASGAERAAVVIEDIESGAIRACVSRPLFSQSNIAESLDDERSPLINRAFLAFSVGSVFKPVVAAAAIEKGISPDFEYNCTGSVEYNGVTFNCHKREGHGVLNMEGALANSCNTYFIALALKTGAEEIIKTASDFGFGRETVFADGIKSQAGNLPSADELDSNAAVANISFGQGALLATPVQICSMMAAIARGGVYIKPYLVQGTVDENGETTEIRNYGEKIGIISEKTAELLKGFLQKVVEQGSGKRAASDAVSSCGKTATAQTGKFNGDEEIFNAWFAGYFPAENPKYAVAILREDGGEGALSCAPVFKEISEKITELERYR